VKTVAIRVGVDVGSKSHQVGIAGSDGQLLEEFQISHSEAGFQEFFDRIEEHRRGNGSSVSVAMEGYNSHSRPLDRHVLEQGYELYSVNNLKLARFREIFPGAAKTDRLDTRKILELFHLKEHLPLAKDVLQRVVQIPAVNARLKRVSRRRRQLVNEKVRVVNRLQSDLQGVCPDLLGLTHDAGNLWFLRFLSCRDDLRQLSRIRMESVLKISGIGKKYAGLIRAWQRTAKFSDEVDYVGSMIISDARRILELIDQISSLESILEELCVESQMAELLSTIPGYGLVTVSELTGEIGSADRFRSESSLALYLGMSPLDKSSGQSRGTRSPRQVNRRAKAAMMTAVARHIGQVPESASYYQKKREEGKKHNQAVRSLGRHMVRVIWSMLIQNRDYEQRAIK